MPPTTSLAERRRVATQLELARIAVRLIAEYGFDGVTVETIAETAGISARTFYRYFPVKEDVVVPLIRNGTAALAEQLAVRPAGEPLTVAIPAAFGAAMSAPGYLAPSESAAFIRLLAQHPALRGRWLDTYQDSEHALAPVIAGRLGLAPDSFEVRLIAVAAMSALRVGMERWAETGGAGDRAATIAQALRFFADGALLGR